MRIHPIASNLPIRQRDPRPMGAADTAALLVNFRDRQLRRDIEVLHRAGWRPYCELLVELGARYSLRTEIETLARKYAGGLDPSILAALDANRVTPW